MFPSLLSSELAAAHRDDLRREAAGVRPRARRDPMVRPALAAVAQAAASAVRRLRPAAAPQACVTC